MNRSEWAERLPLIQAFVEGKTIQYLNPYKKWIDAEGSVDFTDAVEKYRIKPEPKVIWVNEYDRGETKIVHNTEVSAKSQARDGVERVAVKYVEVVE